MNIRFRIIDSVQDFASLESDWRRLEASASISPCYQWAWVSRWWSVYSDQNCSLQIVIGEHRGEVVLIIPLYERLERLWFLKYRVLYFLGTGEEEFEETKSEFGDAIVAADDASIIVEAGVNFLLDRLSRIDRIELRDINESARLAQSFRSNVANREGVMLREQQASRNFRIPVVAAFSDYLAALRPSVRRKLRQVRRRAVEFQLEGPILGAGTSTFDLWDDLVRFHNEYWRAKGSAGAYSADRFLEFHQKLLSSEQANPPAALFGIKVAGRRVAVLHALITHRVISYYQSGIDYGFDRSLRIGYLLHSELVRWCVEHGYQYDLMAGRETSYKAELAPAGEVVSTLSVVRVGMLSWARRCLAKAIRKLQFHLSRATLLDRRGASA